MRSIPQSIQGKINKQNQTIFDNADPRMEVVVARARTTVMDSTYWTVETIRQKVGLGDLVVQPRRISKQKRPDMLFNIYVDTGIVKTAWRKYPDKLKDGWIDQFVVGNGTKVAMAFDGEWEFHNKYWYFITEEKPWIFWIDNAKVLRAQYWDTVETKVQIATGVLECTAIKGWKTIVTENGDQGIVVAYIKNDGKVYYTQYTQAQNLSYSWGIEQQLVEFTETAKTINSFQTNDYRIGFAVENTVGEIYLYITNRNWVAMAAGRDTIKMNLKTSPKLTIGEIEVIRQNTADTLHLDLPRHMVMRPYEVGGIAPPEMTATGEVIDERNFKVKFNTAITTWQPEKLIKTILTYEVLSAEIIGDTIYYKTVGNIDTLGFTVTIQGGVIIGVSNGRQYRILDSLENVQVKGQLPTQQDTLKIDLGVTGTLTVYEITKVFGYTQDTLKLQVGVTGTFAITELSTNPV